MKAASYLEPYWFADDPHAARCLLRARLGYSKLEFDYRRADHHYPRASVSPGLSAQALGHIRQTVMHRLARPPDRACYLCPASDWLPETVSHALQSCSHPQLLRERERLRAALTELINSSAQLPDCPALPSLGNATCLHYLVLLATSVGPTDHRKPVEPAQAASDNSESDDSGLRRSVRLAQRLQISANQPVLPGLSAPPSPAAAAALADRRERCQWLPLQKEEASLAVKWLTFLTSSWRRAISRERESELAAQLGARLVSIIVTYHRQIISIRRRLLQSPPVGPVISAALSRPSGRATPSHGGCDLIVFKLCCSFETRSFPLVGAIAVRRRLCCALLPFKGSVIFSFVSKFS